MNFNLDLKRRTPNEWLSSDTGSSVMNKSRIHKIPDYSPVKSPSQRLLNVSMTKPMTPVFYEQPVSNFKKPTIDLSSSKLLDRSGIFNQSMPAITPERSVLVTTLNIPSFINTSVIGQPSRRTVGINSDQDFTGDPQLYSSVINTLEAKRKTQKAFFWLFFFMVEYFLFYLVITRYNNMNVFADSNTFLPSNTELFVDKLLWGKYLGMKAVILLICFHLIYNSEFFQFDKLALFKTLLRFDILMLSSLIIFATFQHACLTNLQKLFAVGFGPFQLFPLILARFLAEIQVWTDFWLNIENKKFSNLVEPRNRNLFASLRSQLYNCAKATILIIALSVMILNMSRIWAGLDSSVDYSAFTVWDVVNSVVIEKIFMFFVIHRLTLNLYSEAYSFMTNINIQNYIGNAKNTETILSLLSEADKENSFLAYKISWDCLRYIDLNLIFFSEFGFTFVGGQSNSVKVKKNWRGLIFSISKSLQSLGESFQHKLEKEYETQTDFLDYFIYLMKVLSFNSKERNKFISSYKKIDTVKLKIDILKQMLGTLENPRLLSIELEELKPLLNLLEKLSFEIRQFLKIAKEKFWEGNVKAEYRYLITVIDDFLEKSYPILFSTPYKIESFYG